MGFLHNALPGPIDAKLECSLAGVVSELTDIAEYVQHGFDPFVSPSTRVEAGDLVKKLRELREPVQKWTEQSTTVPASDELSKSFNKFVSRLQFVAEAFLYDDRHRNLEGDIKCGNEFRPLAWTQLRKRLAYRRSCLGGSELEDEQRAETSEGTKAETRADTSVWDRGMVSHYSAQDLKTLLMATGSNLDDATAVDTLARMLSSLPDPKLHPAVSSYQDHLVNSMQFSLAGDPESAFRSRLSAIEGREKASKALRLDLELQSGSTQPTAKEKESSNFWGGSPAGFRV